MALIQPPVTGDPQLDSWTLQLTRQINSGLTPGGFGSSGTGGGGGSGGGGGGTPGMDGSDGNSVLYLYQRTTAATPVPTRPTSVTFNFTADPVVSQVLPVTDPVEDNWSSDISAGTGEYIWVTFRYVSTQTGTITDQNSWDTPVLLGVPGMDGEDAVVPRVEIYRLPAGMTTAQVITAYDAETFDFSTLRSSSSGTQFRDNSGEVKVLLVTVQIGGVDATTALHYDFTYGWTKNGLDPILNIAGQNLTRRLIVINADDVNDGGEDVFTCSVEQT